MNIISQEKRQRAHDQAQELQRLRDQLTEKDREIERLQNNTNTTVAQDTDRILELEQEINALRDDLRTRSARPDPDQTMHYDWTLAARDPFSNSYMDVDTNMDMGVDDDDDDDHFGNATMANLITSTPSKRRASASFPTPPATSPTIPFTPCSERRGRTPITPESHHTGVQASLPDPEKEALEAELCSLRLELTKLTEVLESHEDLKMRIASKLATTTAATTATSTTKPEDDNQDTKDVEAHLDTILQALSDRTATLTHLNTSLTSLGFRGADASEVVTSLTGAFRSARLELEYLTPGELTLPLSSRGAQVLDLVLRRLRDLARQVQDDEAAIDEYHALELSLRQQLGARVDAMDSLREESEKERVEKDARIADLELGVERFKGAVAGYRRDVVELESLVLRMDEESRVAEAALQTRVDGAETELADTRAAAAELEAKLVVVREQADACKRQLVDFQKRRVLEIRALNKYHGTALAVRDARVVELRRGIDEVNRSLHEANTTVQQLRVENLGLARRVEEEKSRAKGAVEEMKGELERMLRMSAELLATPKKKKNGQGQKERPYNTRSRAKSSSAAGNAAAAAAADVDVDDDEEGDITTTPDGSPLRRSGTYLSGALAKTGKGKKKRKYDSGLGLLDEDEDGGIDLV